MYVFQCAPAPSSLVALASPSAGWPVPLGAATTQEAESAADDDPELPVARRRATPLDGRVTDREEAIGVYDILAGVSR